MGVGEIKASCQNENLQKLVRSMCQSQIDQRLREEINQTTVILNLLSAASLFNYRTTSINGILSDRI